LIWRALPQAFVHPDGGACYTELRRFFDCCKRPETEFPRTEYLRAEDLRQGEERQPARGALLSGRLDLIFANYADFLLDDLPGFYRAPNCKYRGR